MMEEDPELYGIRRSSRGRKECMQSQRYTYGARVKEEQHPVRRRVQESSSESGSSSSSSSYSYTAPRKKISSNRNRSTRGNRVSYKSAFDDEHASDHMDNSDSQANGHEIRPPPLKALQNRPQGFEPPKPCLVRQVNPPKSSHSLKWSCSLTSCRTRVLTSDNELEEEEKPSHSLRNDAAPSAEETDMIEEVLTHEIRRPGSTGNASTHYNSRIEGDPNAGFDNASEKGELQFLIKWKNWSHLHSTWETEATLRSPDRLVPVSGLKKLELYKQRMRDTEHRKRHAGNKDDLEAIIYEEERDRQALYRYMEVDRIVAHSRDSDSDGVDYLIKWRQLEYRHCTWESGKVIKELYPDSIDDYRKRCQCTKQPALRHEALRLRPKFTRLLDQPDYIGSPELRLREYQLNGLNWIAHAWTRGNSIILADEMGLGKTVQTLSFLAYLYNEFALYGPFLLVVPLSTVSNWSREASLWTPYMNTIVYAGDSTSRQLIREHEWSSISRRNQSLKFNICVTTYEILLKDKAWLSGVTWAVLGVDEAHRLKNDASQLYKCLFTFKSNCRLLITGTPLQNSLKELWALLHFIMPSRFEDWDQFQAQYSVADSKVFQELHRVLAPFLLRRVKKDVEHSLPSKIEQVLRVPMTSRQADIYKLILAKNYDGLMRVTNGNKTSFVNIMMELKKCCNHAYLIAPPNDSDGGRRTASELLTSLVRGSGKLMLLDKLLQRLKPKGHRVLIFSQMVRMLDLIADYLELRSWGFQRLDGSISGEARKLALEHFNADGSNDFCFLLSTRAGGLGINLATADTKKQVSVYRLVTKDSIEEKIIESATRKMVLDHLVIQRMDSSGATKKGDLYTDILKHGAEGLFTRDENNPDADLDIDDILNKAETRDCNDDGAVSEQANALLSTFNIVNVDRFDETEPAGAEDESDSEASSGGSVNALAKGLSEKELRNLVRSIRRFARPLDRVDAIVVDAELSDSTEEEVRALIEAMLRSSRASFDANPAANLTIGRFSTPVKPLLQSIDDLDVLHEFFAARSSKQHRLEMSLPFTPKTVNWSCPWTDKDDLALILGVYLHGYDNWEAIKLDSDLGLGSKLLPVAGADRPQAQHVKTRVDYLLKSLLKPGDRESLKMELGKKLKSARQAAAKVNHNTTPGVHKSAEFVEESSSGSSGDDREPSQEAFKKPVPEPRKKKRRKEPAAITPEPQPMHFTAHKKPTSLREEEELQFVERNGPLYDNCKRQCRPIRKHFQSLEQLEDDRKCRVASLLV
ncbi:transcriptional regulator [Cichlidogyrus casuarinus]|uniref:Transcriptional regulator n=1 Tax=Cichlidogyrus casuarinus TaxID=1844966 RepID=A0ABD2Q2W2_9PLAT